MSEGKYESTRQDFSEYERKTRQIISENPKANLDERLVVDVLEWANSPPYKKTIIELFSFLGENNLHGWKNSEGILVKICNLDIEPIGDVSVFMRKDTLVINFFNDDMERQVYIGRELILNYATPLQLANYYKSVKRQP